MRRGKVIGSVVIVVVMDTKIAKSGNLGTRASCKCNESVEFIDKLASVYLELSSTAYKRHKWCIFVGHHSHAYQPCPYCLPYSRKYWGN